MTHLPYDVYLASRNPGSPMSLAVANGLTRRGFRVHVADRVAGALAERSRRATIEEASDFVLVSAADDPPPPDGPPDSFDAEVQHAVATGRNLLWMAEGTETGPRPPLPSRYLGDLKPWQYVPYGAERSREAIAILSFRLLSSQEVDDRKLMRRAKQLSLVALVAFLIVVAGLVVPPLVRAWKRPKPLPSLPPFQIAWTGVGQRLEAGRWTGFRLETGTQVMAGDRLRLVFTPGSDGYAFVIATDLEGGVRVVFPNAAVRGLSRVTAGRTYDAPGPDTWLTVDASTGLAGLFIIGSYDSLENLDELAETPEGEGSPKARLDLFTQTLNGLLDGRHAAVRTPLFTRSGQIVLGTLKGASLPERTSVTLSDGSRAEYPVATERGLVGAAVELHLRFVR